MKLSATAVMNAAGGLGLASVLLAPFAFGAVNPPVFVSLSWLWIGLGLLSMAAARRTERLVEPNRLDPAPRVLVALHLLCAVQLLPLPSSLLRIISPGSFAAHFIPPSGARTWAPLTASPIGTGQAWLFIIGLHGLALTLFGGDRANRARQIRLLFLGIAAVGGLLAIEGLVQSKSPHPYWLYGLWEVPGAGAHEMGIFGPYYNRDNYSNLIAIAASVTSGLLAASLAGSGSRGPSSLLMSAHFGRHLALIVALLLMIAASAASGSRGGLIALGVGLGVGGGPALLTRPRLALGTVLLLIAVLFGTGIPEAFTRLADPDFETARLQVWRDAARLIEFFPIFGCGIGAFAPAYWPYQRVVRFEYWPHLHNEYGQWLLEGGLLGMALAAYALRRLWVAAPRVIRLVENRPALAGLAAALTHALVDFGFRVPANAAWAAMLLVCLAASEGSPSSPDLQAPATLC